MERSEHAFLFSDPLHRGLLFKMLHLVSIKELMMMTIIVKIDVEF